MRGLIAIGTGLVGLAAAGTTTAQSLPRVGPDWTGTYVGVDIGLVGGRSGDAKAAVDPARDARFTYVEGPAAQTLSTSRDLPRKTNVALRAGRLFQSGSLVWGLEGQVGGARLDRDFEFGPFDAGTIRTVPLPGVASPTRTVDSLSTTLEIDAVASLRARVGLPLGDRALVSVFAGPALARARASLTQKSVIEAFSCTNPARPAMCFNNPVEVINVGPGSDDDLWGGVIGGAVDLKLSDRWIVRGEAGVSRYDDIQARSGGTGGGDSRFAYEPELYWVSIGLSRRF